MAGQARVAGSQRRPQIVLSADAPDGSGWHLAVDLAPAFDQAGRGSGERRGDGIPLVGELTLTGPGNARVSAPARASSKTRT